MTTNTSSLFDALTRQAHQNTIDATHARNRAHNALEAAETHLARCRHLEFMAGNLAAAQRPQKETPTP